MPAAEMAPQQTVVPHDEVVDALTPQGPDHAFDEGILPAASSRVRTLLALEIVAATSPVDPPSLWAGALVNPADARGQPALGRHGALPANCGSWASPSHRRRWQSISPAIAGTPEREPVADLVLTNHASQLASCDFFTVPTATFGVVCVLGVLSHK